MKLIRLTSPIDVYIGYQVINARRHERGELWFSPDFVRRQEEEEGGNRKRKINCTRLEYEEKSIGINNRVLMRRTSRFSSFASTETRLHFRIDRERLSVIDFQKLINFKSNVSIFSFRYNRKRVVKHPVQQQP